ncbi:hypothetical protein DFH07DRAFT_764288 [Mycena maculata]|uniref:Uncharacterized protein n=1 Tax=Mycena maculata TaxID=230809 RepID=A0AAD7P1E7_9AGAR|nr:hypothetical protein DFH07DRAFT_764288 [Mycena maculata]
MGTAVGSKSGTSEEIGQELSESDRILNFCNLAERDNQIVELRNELNKIKTKAELQHTKNVEVPQAKIASLRAEHYSVPHGYPDCRVQMKQLCRLGRLRLMQQLVISLPKPQGSPWALNPGVSLGPPDAPEMEKRQIAFLNGLARIMALRNTPLPPALTGVEMPTYDLAKTLWKILEPAAVGVFRSLRLVLWHPLFTIFRGPPDFPDSLLLIRQVFKPQRPVEEPDSMPVEGNRIWSDGPLKGTSQVDQLPLDNL